MYDEFFHTTQGATSSSPPDLDTIDWSQFIEQVGTGYVPHPDDHDIIHLPQLGPDWCTTPSEPSLQREILDDSDNNINAPVTSSTSLSQCSPIPPAFPGHSNTLESGSSPMPPPFSSSQSSSPLQSLVHAPLPRCSNHLWCPNPRYFGNDIINIVSYNEFCFI